MGPNPTVPEEGGPTDPQSWDVADMPSEWYPPPPRQIRLPRPRELVVVVPFIFTGEIRMTPWGLQGRYQRGEERFWHPKVGDREDTTDIGVIRGQVLGRWLRDWDKFNENQSPRSDSDRHLRRMSMSIGGYSHPLSAYPPGRGHILCDLDWDMAERADSDGTSGHSVISSPKTQHKSSPYRFDQLPAEVWKMIVAFLVPVGCAYCFITFDYLLYPSAEGNDLAGARFCSLVQLMIPVWPTARSSDFFSPAPPVVRGSAHMAVANTNRFFQDLVYERFFGGNSFILHQTTSRILFSWTRSEDFNRWQSWSRIITHSEPDDEPGKAPFGLLGPLGPRAAKYLRKGPPGYCLSSHRKWRRRGNDQARRYG